MRINEFLLVVGITNEINVYYNKTLIGNSSCLETNITCARSFKYRVVRLLSLYEKSKDLW